MQVTSLTKPSDDHDDERRKQFEKKKKKVSLKRQHEREKKLGCSFLSSPADLFIASLSPDRHRMRGEKEKREEKDEEQPEEAKPKLELF